MKNPLPHTQVVHAAIKLSGMELIMKSYIDLRAEISDFAFTTNSNLSQRVLKPSYFPSYQREFVDYWKNKLTPQKKSILCYLAQVTNNSVNERSFELIKNAYDKWPQNHYGLFYGNAHSWSCNLFVGEALFLSGIHALTHDGKYFTANQICNGENRFAVIEKRDRNNKLLVSEGDIACFGNGHVEIVTKVNINAFADDDFCSRGAGRGDESEGEEKSEHYYGSMREIDNCTITFVRVV